jgi:hypothetical protein
MINTVENLARNFVNVPELNVLQSKNVLEHDRYENLVESRISELAIILDRPAARSI